MALEQQDNGLIMLIVGIVFACIMFALIVKLKNKVTWILFVASIILIITGASLMATAPKDTASKNTSVTNGTSVTTAVTTNGTAVTTTGSTSNTCAPPCSGTTPICANGTCVRCNETTNKCSGNLLCNNITGGCDTMASLLNWKGNPPAGAAGRCGPQFENKACPTTTCCSNYGWCGGTHGTTSPWCLNNGHGIANGEYDGLPPDE